jgi:phage-related minor tail protein
MIAKSTRSSDLKSREWEVKQLESKQDKTIVEHVHVPEEAKRVTDRQLADAQKELQKSTAYIRSLEKSKTRLTGEAEDLARQTERERVELRAKEKAAKAQEERAAKAIADIMKERRAKETAELASPRLHPPRLRCPSSIVLIVPLVFPPGSPAMPFTELGSAPSASSQSTHNPGAQPRTAKLSSDGCDNRDTLFAR